MAEERKQIQPPMNHTKEELYLFSLHQFGSVTRCVRMLVNMMWHVQDRLEKLEETVKGIQEREIPVKTVKWVIDGKVVATWDLNDPGSWRSPLPDIERKEEGKG